MYALFSKGFGKKAADMNKKEFLDTKPGADRKVTVKGSTSTGVGYEFNTNPSDSRYSDVSVSLPVDPKCSITVKNESSVSKEGAQEFANEVEAAINVASGMDLTLNFENLNIDHTQTTVKADFNYQTEAFSLEIKSNINDPKASNRGFSAAFATDIPVEAAAGFKAGIQVGKDFDKVMNFLAGVSYDAKDFSLAVKGAVGARNNVKDEGLTLLNPTLLGLYKINASSSIAFEIVNQQSKAPKDAWGAHAQEQDKDGNPVAGKNGMKITVGGDYKLNDTHKLKYKYTTGNTADLAITSNLGGGASLSSQLSLGGKGTAYGFVYTLDA